MLARTAARVHVESVTVQNLQRVLWSQLDPKTTIMTDEARVYTPLGRGFARHGTVNHSADEYVRGDVHTNTVESYFALLNRGIIGIYQHCRLQHLKRDVGEFDFRYNHRHVTDAERTDAALAGIEGKRLFYRDSSSPARA